MESPNWIWDRDSQQGRVTHSIAKNPKYANDARKTESVVLDPRRTGGLLQDAGTCSLRKNGCTTLLSKTFSFQAEMFQLAKIGALDNVALFMAAQSLYRLRNTEFSASCHPGSLRLFVLVSWSHYTWCQLWEYMGHWTSILLGFLLSVYMVSILFFAALACLFLHVYCIHVKINIPMQQRIRHYIHSRSLWGSADGLGKDQHSFHASPCQRHPLAGPLLAFDMVDGKGLRWCRCQSKVAKLAAVPETA